MGPMDVLRALQRRSPSSVSSSRRRGRRCRSSTDSSVDDRADTSPSRSGLRLKVRILVALPGILTARLVLGVASSARLSLASLVRVFVRLDLPGVAVVDSFLYLRGVSPGVGWPGRRFQSPMTSSRRSGSSPVLLVSGSGPDSFTRSGRSFIGAPQRGSCRWVDCCLACPRAGVCGLPWLCGLPHGY